MAARLEVEIDGVNTGLKKSLNDSLIELTRFNRELNFKPKGVNDLNASLSITKQLLKDISISARDVRSAVGNRALFESPSAELNSARVASENYRTESARLASELANLRVQNAQNRQSTAATSGSYREAQQRLTALGRSIREVAGGFNSTNPAIQSQIREYRQLNTQLRTFDAQLGNHQRNVGNYRSALNGITGFAAGAFGFTALITAGAAVIRSNKEISDSLSDVRRTAGLTAKEATELGIALKGIDTRSTLKELLSISKIGGQLGIDKNQLVGFTKAVDQLAVALGDELKGGAEGIAKSLGVLDNVFKVSASNGGNIEKSYNQIGSAILQLGQSGLATGDFLADFGERVGGIAKQAGISLPTVLSFGAVLQENGVSAEVAGTAFKRLISAISSNSGKFFEVAKIANSTLTLKEFNNVVNTDTKKALDLFFAGLQKGGSSTVAFNSILKNLKLSGAGVSQVVSALSSNIPALNKHIDESTKALTDGTLASEQFAIKNDNLAASFDKLGNALTNITTNPDSNIGRWMKGLVESFTGGIKVVDKLAGKINGLFDAVSVLNDRRLIEDNKDNIIALSEQGQAELDAAKKREAQRKKIEQDAIRSQKSSTALKVGAKMNRAAIIDIQAESNSKNILSKTNDRLALEEKNLATIREKYSEATTFKVKDELAKQLIAQREFIRLLKLEAQSLTPRSTSEVPDAFKAKTKKTPINRAPEILAKSNKSEDLFGLSGVDKEVENVRQQYIKLFSDLRDNAKKSAEGRKTFEADFATLQKNEASEITSIIISEKQRQADEIQRINNESGVAANEDRQKELAAIQKWYDAEILKARDSADIIAAINEGKNARINAVDAKYQAKRLDLQNDLNSKLQDLAEKGFTLNENFSNKTTQRNKEALKQRLKDVSENFEKLKALYANNPLALTVLGIAQGGVINQAKANFGDAEGGAGRKLLQDLASGFGNNVFRILTTINQQADRSFTSIIGSIGESLSSMLQDTFGNQLNGILQQLVSGVGISATQAVAGLAGIAGGIISGVTKKTDIAGQTAGGALTGAASGAIAGSVVPGLGTAAGAIIGGVVGALGGFLGANKAQKEARELQKRQLEEAKKQTDLLRQNATLFTSAIIGRMTDQGILTNVDINATGQLIATVNGKQIDFVLGRTNNSRG